MAKLLSALDGVSYDGYVQVQEMGLMGMVTLRADLSLVKLAKALKTHLGVEMPKMRQISIAKDNAAAWMSPDELLLLMPHDQAEAVVAKLRKTMGKTHSLIVNVSDARAMFCLRGAGGREVLAKLSPADMQALAPGEIRRSRLAQVPAAFWLAGPEEIHLVAFRSVAQYVFDVLKTAAQPGGELGIG